jgi:glycine/D-amino acid oxidase-like deaminating enzyme
VRECGSKGALGALFLVFEDAMTATKEKDLRTGQPVWEAYPAPRVPHTRLTRNIETDVLIIGAGITGAMIGEALAGTGLDIAIVDYRPPMKGATAASTSLIQFEIDMPLIEMCRKIGTADAIRTWRRSRLAVTNLAAHLRTLGVEAQRRDALYLAGNRLDVAGLRREADARMKAGFETLFLTRKQLKERFGIRRGGALFSYDNLAADPRAMTATLLKAAARKGARIHSPEKIVRVESKKTFVIAATESGRAIRARTLIFATGYELAKGVPKKGHRITATWAIGTRPQKRNLWPEECLIWEASDPYLYMRTTGDGRVICGGEDDDISDEKERDALLEKKTAILCRKLAKLFPALDTKPAFAWTASFGESTTSLPSIGRVPGMRHCWAALGYGGNGITYSRIAADVIRAELTGDGDPDADLYRFNR